MRGLFLRFIAKTEVRKGSECIFWVGAVSGNGYGYMRNERGEVEGAHRISYRLFRGPSAKGLGPDHLCETPLCINPYHMEAVTKTVNTERRNQSYFNDYSNWEQYEDGQI